MKKFLCFLGIFSLIVLIALPPTLRILVPKVDEEEEKKDELVIQALSCDGDNYIARTRYENGIVKMVLIKKNIANNSEEGDNQTPLETPSDNEESQDGTDNLDDDVQENPDTNPTEPGTLPNLAKFEETFTRLSEDSRIAKDEMEDGISLTIDFSIYNSSDLNVDELTKPINDQKIYYEDLGLTCGIIE